MERERQTDKQTQRQTDRHRETDKERARIIWKVHFTYLLFKHLIVLQHDPSILWITLLPVGQDIPILTRRDDKMSRQAIIYNVY